MLGQYSLSVLQQLYIMYIINVEGTFVSVCQESHFLHYTIELRFNVSQSKNYTCITVNFTAIIRLFT